MLQRIRSYCLLNVFLLLICQLSVGQSFNNPNVFQLKSPQVTQIEKIGLVPTNLSTGQINPSINIYNYVTSDITIPISLNYSNTGLKIGENATWVGLGWNLFAGGVISQNVKGISDFSPNGLYSSVSTRLLRFINNQMTSTERDFYQMDVTSLQEDSERDIFSFNFLGRSGIFYFDATNTLKQFYKNDLVITYSAQSNIFTIRDEKGVLYTFGINEYSSVSDGDITSNTPVIINGASWYLTSITTPNNDVITFTYGNTEDISETGNSSTLSFGATANSSGCSSSHSLDMLDFSSSYTVASQKFLRSIESRFGKVYFNTIPFREDLKPTGTSTKGQVLDEIVIQSNDGMIIRKAKFSYDHFLGVGNVNNNRLKLQSVKICGGADCNTNSQLYRFSYYAENSILPPVGSASKDFDHWGYYNGAQNNKTLPTFDASQFDPYAGYYYGADKNANSSYSQYGMLKEIEYPTGGRTEFEYEANELDISGYQSLPPFIITSSPATFKIGGNRIKRINYKTELSTTSSSQFFEYSKETSFKYLPNYLTIKDRRRYLNENPFIYNSCGNTYIVNDRPLNSMPGFHIEYAFVVVKDAANGSTGVVKNYFIKTGDYGSGSQPFPYVVNTSWRSGTLSAKESYKKNGSNNDYTMINSKWSTYSATFSDPMSINNTSMKIALHTIGVNSSNAVSYDIGVYSYFTELFKATESSEQEFNENNTISKGINLFYESPVHSLVTRETSLLSNGKTEDKRYYYVKDFDISASSNISTLIQKNINNLLRKDRLVDGKLTNSSFSRLTSTGLPESINDSKVITPDNYPVISTNSLPLNGITYQENATYAYDNFGNVIQITQIGMQKGYIWDYNGVYPIAEVLNGVYSAVAATSFESDGKGNWDYVAGGITNGDGITGNKAYSLGAGNIQRTGLQAAQTYIVSYWQKTGSVSINGNGAGTAILSKNGWTLYQLTIAGTTTVTVSGSALIDELRLYPSDAQMTTYTYTPLVGMTSQCDANNKITYYEYDNFQRLTLVRDQDRNIIKQYCYNYAGITPVPCSEINTIPNWVVTGNSRCVVVNNNNTGEQEVEQHDGNPNSNLGYRWVSAGTNTTACPLPSPTVYARLSYENIYTTFDGYQYADIVVRTYSDSDCTQPASVNNLTINYTVDDSCASLAANNQSMTGSLVYLSNSAALVYANPWCGDVNNCPCFVNYYLDQGTGYIIR